VWDWLIESICVSTIVQRWLRLILVAVTLVTLILGVLIHLMLLVVTKAIISRSKISVDVYTNIYVALSRRRDLLLRILTSLKVVHVVITHELLMLLLTYLFSTVHALFESISFETFFLVRGCLTFLDFSSLAHSVTACHDSSCGFLYLLTAFLRTALEASYLCTLVTCCQLGVLFD
jgi:hypothetical protein